MQTLDWNDLRYVLAAARAGHFQGAGRRLRVDGTTVARRLATIEAALGTRLFDRVAGGTLAPTPAGETAIARAEEVEHVVGALRQEVAGIDAAVAGTVRITAVPLLVNHLLVPAAGALARRHPAIRLELIAEPRNLSLTRREADLALRFARPDAGAGARTLARRVARLDHAVYGAASAPAGLPWVTYEDGASALPQARWMARAIAAGDAMAPFAVNDAAGALQAALAGIGRTVLPVVIGDRTAGLVRLPAPAGLPPLTRELWLLSHPETRGLGRIAAAIEWLDALFARG
jgi:DNA-binding transcriptional LysR family regulator